MKYLIAGLGNIGEDYRHTRHNIGFEALDYLADKFSVSFSSDRYVHRSVIKHKGRTFVLIKPTTYMNLSGKAVNYWLQKESIDLKNLLVITDDIAIPFGTLRLKTKGSDGGHNGLKDINAILGRSDYPRLRFGVGSQFQKGRQVQYVLGKWNEEESQALEERLDKVREIVLAFGTIGVDRTMSTFNNK